MAPKTKKQKAGRAAFEKQQQLRRLRQAEEREEGEMQSGLVTKVRGEDNKDTVKQEAEAVHNDVDERTGDREATTKSKTADWPQRDGVVSVSKEHEHVKTENPVDKVELKRKRAYVRIPKTPLKRKVDVKTIAALRPRPSTPSPLFCFVCAVVPSQKVKVTREDCSSLLTNMLELNRSQSDHYLDKLGQPEKYIGLCYRCRKLIREVSSMKVKISRLENEVRKRQRLVVERIKETKLNNVRDTGRTTTGGGGGKEQLLVIQNILKYVHNRKYHLTMPVSVVKGKAGGGHVKVRAFHLKKVQTCRDHRPWNRVKSAEVGSLPRFPTTSISSSTTPLTAETEAPILREDFGGEKETWEDFEFDKDPLACEEEDEFKEELSFPDEIPSHSNPDEVQVSKFVSEEESADGLPPAPVRINLKVHSHSQLFYCGLCSDDQPYTSEKQLQLHTNQAHHRTASLPPPPPPAPSTIQPAPSRKIIRKKKRRRKQTFCPSSEEEWEEAIVEEAAAATTVLHPIPITAVQMLATARSEASKIKMSWSSSGAEGSSIPTAAAAATESEAASKPQMTSSAAEEPTPAGIEATEEEPLKFKRGSYSCPNCPAVKDYGVNRYAQHLAIHQRRPYKCLTCSELLPEDEDLRKQHWQTRHPTCDTELAEEERFIKSNFDPGEIWKCQGCSTGFIAEAARDRHELECVMLSGSQTASSPNFPYPCVTCSKPSRNLEEWRLHRVLHHPHIDLLSCLCCDLSFGEKTLEGVEARHDEKMLNHIKQDHPYRYQANTALYQYPGGRIYDECESCGLIFLSSTGIDARKHFQEIHGASKEAKNFPCPLSCGGWFSAGYAVRRHFCKVHFPGDPSVCDVCGVSFKQPITLQEHRFREHGIQPERGFQLFTCPVEGCDFQTVRKQSMDTHSIMVHGSAKKYICKTCGKGFSDLCKLKGHEQIHENKEKKPYQCELCGNSFAVRNYLYIHKRLSHENRKFPSTNRKRTAKPKTDDGGRSNGENKKTRRRMAEAAAASDSKDDENPKGSKTQPTATDVIKN